MSKICTYFKSILIPLIVGGVVSIIIFRFMDYNSLQKPLLAPPSMVFPIVWTILYLLMGISYGMLKSKDLTNIKTDLIYYIQLGINALWPVLFFVLKWRLISFIWILILLASVIIMTIEFYKKNKLSGFLQIPYIIWVVFASYLNLFIYLLNK